MKMLGKRVLLQKVEKENVTKGGIILTQPEKERTVECIIISAGTEVQNLKQGDKVIADSYKLNKLNDNYFCDEEDVLAILED